MRPVRTHVPMGLMRRLAFIALVAVVSCGPASASIGPVTLKVPEGWMVTDREGNNLKLTNGTVADANSTKPGTATAVFDIYVASPQTPEAFADYLREQHIGAQRKTMRIDGYAAELFSYRGESVGGRQEAVLIPRWRVFILYRAAFRGADAAFLRGRAAFRRALDSITFSGGSSSAIGSSRHGPMRGKSAITARPVPAAMSTNPS